MRKWMVLGLLGLSGVLAVGVGLASPLDPASVKVFVPKTAGTAARPRMSSLQSSRPLSAATKAAAIAKLKSNPSLPKLGMSPPSAFTLSAATPLQVPAGLQLAGIGTVANGPVQGTYSWTFLQGVAYWGLQGVYIDNVPAGNWFVSCQMAANSGAVFKIQVSSGGQTFSDTVPLTDSGVVFAASLPSSTNSINIDSTQAEWTWASCDFDPVQ